MKVQASLLCWHLCQTKKETSLPGLVAFERMSGQGVLGLVLIKATRYLLNCKNFHVISQRSQNFLIFLCVLCELCERSNGPINDHARWFKGIMIAPQTICMYKAILS
jgi:hypothetical protein